MKQFNHVVSKVAAVVAVAFALNACQEPAADLATPSNELSVKPIKQIGATSGPAAGECTITNITANRTFDRDTVYVLNGDVRVNNNAILTIESGTVIRGSKTRRGSLTIERGAKIIAIGTATQPIVFTSNQAIGARNPQDWGGLLICGKAPNNQGPNVSLEGFPACVTAPQYGGTVSNDDSGTLRFVRIEYAGIPSATVANSEKNSLTLASVGSATDIDHIQVSFAGDDSYEWFGGTVRAKFLISYSGQDDDFDTDFGYSGLVQYGIGIRDPQRADVSNSNGFESDTDADGVNTTRTTARFTNFTLIGPYDPFNTPVVNSATEIFQHGMQLRRNTGLDVYNSIITGWPQSQFFADVNVTSAAVATDNRAVKPFNVAASLCFTEPASPNNVWTLATGARVNLCNNPISNNDMIAKSGLTAAAWTLSNPNVIPAVSSTVLTDGRNANALNSFFSANTTSATITNTFFSGARREADDNGWNFSGAWVNYDPQNVDYRHFIN